MTKWAAGEPGSGIALGAMAKGGGLAAILLLGAGLAAHFLTREAPGPTPPVAVSSDQAEDAAPQAAASLPAMATPDLADPAAQDTPETSASAPAQAAPPAPPGFDLLRIEPDGSGLAAGRAQPGSSVTLLVDGTELGSAAAGESGEFAIFFTLPPSDVPRLLTLRMRLAGGQEIASLDQVVLAPGDVSMPAAELPVGDPVLAAIPPEGAVAENPSSPAQSGPETAVPPALGDRVAQGPASAPGAGPALSSQADPSTPAGAVPAAPGLAATPEAPQAAEAPPAAPTDDGSQDMPEMAAILLGPDGVRVLQPGGAAAPGQIRPVIIDAISYTATGAVQLGGRGTPGQTVRLYLDNAALTEFPVAADGGWGGVLPDIAPGRYTLRADQVGADGAVTARFETPFQRETLAALAAATGQPVSAGGGVAAAEAPAAPQTEAAGAANATEATTIAEAGTAAATAGSTGAGQAGDPPANATVSAGTDPQTAAGSVSDPGPVAQATSGPVAPSGSSAPSAPVVTPEVAANTDSAAPPPSTLPQNVSAPPVPAEVTVTGGAAAPVAPAPVAAQPATAEPVATPPAQTTATAAAAPAAPVSVTVQPGFTLWAIARDQLGEGVLYVQVFEANRDRIRNPDLIYPGQVFAIPERGSP